METGFVIVTLDNPEILGRCLEALVRQTHRDFVVHIIDNGDGGLAAEVAETFRGRLAINVTANNANLGFATANNKGINEMLATHPDARFLVLLNDDAFLEPNWLSEMRSHLVANPDVGLAQGANFLSLESRLYDSTGIYLTKGMCPKQRGYMSDVPQLDIRSLGPNAAAAILRRELIEDITVDGEFFDERFFAYVEDVDVLLRAFSRGWQHAYVPSAAVHHLGSSTGSRFADRKLYWGARNLVWTIYKNFPPEVIRAQRQSIMRSFTANLQILNREDRRLARIYASGVWYGLFTRPLFSKKKRGIAARRLVSAQHYFNVLVESNDAAFDSDPFSGWICTLVLSPAIRRFLNELSKGVVKKRIRDRWELATHAVHVFFHDCALKLWNQLPRSSKDRIKSLVKRK